MSESYREQLTETLRDMREAGFTECAAAVDRVILEMEQNMGHVADKISALEARITSDATIISDLKNQLAAAKAAGLDGDDHAALGRVDALLAPPTEYYQGGGQHGDGHQGDGNGGGGHQN